MKSRFKLKLASSIIGLATNAGMLSFVPKILGVDSYGQIDLIVTQTLVFFTSACLSQPEAYFNWASRHERNKVLSGLLAVSLFLLLILAMSFAGLKIWIELANSSFTSLNIEQQLVFLGLLFAFETIFFNLITSAFDGLAATKTIEFLRIFINVLRLISLAILALFGALSSTSFFLSQLSIVFIGIFLGLAILFQKSTAANPWKFSKTDLMEYFSFSWRFTKPLIVYSMVGLTYSFFDRWLLQMQGGLKEQGAFALANRFSSICFLFTSSMTPILIREFASNHQRGDMMALRLNFEKIKYFVALAAFFSFFVLGQSRQLILLTAGTSFLPATVVVGLMGLYAIHQTFGQLSNSLLSATGQTGLYSKVGMAIMLISMPVSYFLLGPKQGVIPALELGAIGLVIKMLLIQFIGTQVFLVLNCRYLQISYRHWLFFQIEIFTVGAFAAFVTWISSRFTESLMESQSDFFASFVSLIVAGVLYLGIWSVYGLIFGRSLGLDGAHLRHKIQRLLGQTTS